ncbi:MAG TPA: hypothetical protein ENI95_09080 [Chloroflexi bacterium]|nr:hypothetical protein [Chloroflexota bacterium]
MSWRTAFTNLAAISVAGVVTSYDLDDLPNTLPAAELPALVPGFPEGVGLIGEEEIGFSTLTYDGAVWRATLHVEHTLFWSPAWSDVGLSAALPDLVTAIDDYLTALSADGTLGGALDEELEILDVRPGVVEYAGVRFYGVRFRHRWKRAIG